jgi:hypothetical protein
MEMDPDQIHKSRDEVMDKYLRNELFDEETAMFEEHLLFCKECRDALSQRSRMIVSIQNVAAGDIFQIRRKREGGVRKYLPIIGYAAAAAGVALVLGLFFFSNRDQASISSQGIVRETEVQTGKDPEPAEENIAGKTDTDEKGLQKDLRRRSTYLAEFKANPVYENLIGVQYRSDNLRVKTPSDSIDCKIGTSIIISFEGAQTDSLFLVLLNRLGVILLEKKISSPYKLDLQFPEGLYYWQLTDEEEALFTAKIFLRSGS